MKRRFTLIETLVVLVILVMVVGTVMPRLLRIPSRVQVEGAQTNILSALRECAVRAVASGRTVRVRLAADTRRFEVTTAPAEQDVLSDTKLPDSADGSEASRKGDSGPVPGAASYKIPKGVVWELDDWEFSDDPDAGPLFLFHPDGSASGPDLAFVVAKHRFLLRVDRLTAHAEAHAIE